MNSVTFEGNSCYPSKIVCIGRNYLEHIKELNSERSVEPVVFLKPNSAISDQLIATADGSIHYEAEITFLIENEKPVAIAFGLDLTKRKLQRELKDKKLPWERSKAFNASAVFSEFVRFESLSDTIRLQLFINDQLVQEGSVAQMLYPPNTILENVTQFLSLEDGDIIMTGTPKGVGPINIGDQFIGKIYQGEKLLLESDWQAQVI